MLRIVFLALFNLTILFTGVANSQSSCRDTLLNSIQDKWATEIVEIVFFPIENHTKLRIDEDVYFNSGPCPGTGSCAHTSNKATERLGTLGSGPQFRIRIKVKPEELTRIRRYIEMGNFGSKQDFNCVNAVCNAITRTTNLKIPFPFNFGPFSNALYLSLARLLPWTRVEKLRIVFPRKAGNPILYANGAIAGLGELVVLDGGIVLTGYGVVKGIIELLPI